MIQIPSCGLVRTTVLSGILAASATAQIPMAVETVTLTPDRDATLYEDLAGRLANGAGDQLVVGRGGVGPSSSDDRRRAILHFDILGNVPPGSTILDVRVTITEVESRGFARSVILSEFFEEWTEGTTSANSNPFVGAPAMAGDPTWRHATEPNVFWSVPGVTSVSAPLAVEPFASGPLVFDASTALNASVQRTLDQPGLDASYLLTSNEFRSGDVSAYGSRESLDPPQMTITYVPPTASVVQVAPSCTVGPIGPFTMSTIGVPTPGNQTFAFLLSAPTPPVQLQAVGFSIRQGLPILLPGSRGGCQLRLDLQTLLDVRTTPLSGFPGLLPFPIPPRPEVVGVEFFAQGIALDMDQVLETTNLLRVRVGR